MKQILHLLALASLLFLCRCKKMADMDGDITTPGVAITFDDNSVNNWHRSLGLLDSLQIKATFYVSGYHTLNARQKQMLKEIQQRGHEIEYHSTNHRNLENLVLKKGWDFVYNTEIKPDLERMQSDGYDIHHFAYPFGKHCSFLDNKLLKLFTSIRALDGTTGNSNCFAVSTNSRVLYSMGIDESSKPTLPVLEQKLTKCITDYKCLVLLGHEIENPGYRYQTTKATLCFIADFVRRHQMRFYRVDEIARR